MIIHLDQGHVAFGDEEAREGRPLEIVVVDEAHHVHEAGDLERVVDEYASGDSTRLVLLSDVSQSAADEMAVLFGARTFRLCEVSLGRGELTREVIEGSGGRRGERGGEVDELRL